MRTTGKIELGAQQEAATSEYVVAAKNMSVEDKLKVLEGIGRPELIEVFKGYQPRQVKARKKSAPLDQRVSITVTDKERVDLQHDLAQTNKTGPKITVSQFVRKRAIGAVDIHGWRDIAMAALEEINDIDSRREELTTRERTVRLELESTDDPEEVGMLEKELSTIAAQFRKVTAQNEKRKNRLSGRMSMAEAETIKWRASRLCISTSDYLRFLIFDLLPDTAADAHMSLAAKRRFYVSIIDVADNGWGTAPTIAHCTQCSNYLDEIARLRDQVRQLETFA